MTIALVLYHAERVQNNEVEHAPIPLPPTEVLLAQEIAWNLRTVTLALARVRICLSLRFINFNIHSFWDFLNNIFLNVVLLVDGNWSSWGDYSTCSASCGAGTKQRSRTCTDPPPSNGGSTCAGDSMETTNCDLGNCPSKNTFQFILVTCFVNLTSYIS